MKKKTEAMKKTEQQRIKVREFSEIFRKAVRYNCFDAMKKLKGE